MAEPSSNSKYPRGFPSVARAAVTAAEIQAQHGLRRAPASDPDRTREIISCILHPFLTYTQEACKLVNRGVWPVEDLRVNALEYLRLATIEVVSVTAPHLLNIWIDNIYGALSGETMRIFQKAPEWQQYEKQIDEAAQAAVARMTDAAVAGSPNSLQRRGYRAEVKQWMAANGLKTLDEAATRLAVSKSTLKSIMTTTGQRRYGDSTLNRVLAVIGSLSPASTNCSF